MKINDVVVDPKLYVRDHKVYLHHQTVTSGSNAIEISYVNNYRLTGTGLHKFVDPVDGNAYLYSQLCVFHANKVFPCFDQPDIKARMHLTMITDVGNI